MTCSWAACSRPAVTSEGGDSLGPWWHCADHLREHRAQDAEANPRTCDRCGEPFVSRTMQARICQDCRNVRPHQRQVQPCGTRAARERHRVAGEPPCDECNTAQAIYFRARYEQRKSA